MNDPALYIQGNKAQRNFAKAVIDEYCGLLRLRADGKDSLMDVGCGTGDVLMDFVVPILPKTYSKVVGTDVSPRMIQYSREAYAEHDRVEFKVLDIRTHKIPLEFYEQFDHVTSFYCLHWVPDKRQALNNIYNMLSEGGDCFLLFIYSSYFFDVLQLQAANLKWSEYTQNAGEFIPVLEKLEDPLLAYTNLFKEAGFSHQQVEIPEKVVVFEGYDHFKNWLDGVNPFHDQIPTDRREEFMDDLLKCFEELRLSNQGPVKDDYKYTVPFRQVVAYARK